MSAQRRLIPAWAGKTRPDRPPRAVMTAHPRVGGENDAPRSDAVEHEGSSPRGRGKLGHLIGIGKFWRLIPAWAGKTNLTP